MMGQEKTGRKAWHVAWGLTVLGFICALAGPGVAVKGVTGAEAKSNQAEKNMKPADFPRGAISPEQSARLLKAAQPESYVLVDVRQVEAFDEGHLPGAVNIPLNELEARMGEIPADTPVLLACQTGNMAAEAYELLREKRPELKVAYIKAHVCYPDGKPYQLTMEP